MKYDTLFLSYFFFLHFMNTGKIISKNIENTLRTKGDFKVLFNHKEFGPYEYLYDKEKLYFNEAFGDRGNADFPLVGKNFENAEIFLEREDIVVAVGSRGSISGNEKKFIDIISLSSWAKNRFFTDEVRLIYNSENAIEVFIKEENSIIHYTLDTETLEEREKREENISAFFKLLYNWDTQSYENLVFENPTGWKNTGYFIRKKIPLSWEPNTVIENIYAPKYFVSKVFTLGTDAGMIDVWESTLYNELRFSDR